MTRKLMVVFALYLGVFALASHADVTYQVTLDTTPLIGHTAAPFSLDFQMVDGSFSGDGNNTASLSNFSFGVGGSATGSALLTGGATGDLTSGLALTDSSVLSDAQQGFTPGDTLSFLLKLSTNVDSGSTPDAFSFTVLDNTGSGLPMQSFFDVFVEIDINGSLPSVTTSATDSTQTPLGGGPPITMGPPIVTLLNSPVPEPSSVPLLVTGIAALGALRRKK